MATVTCHTDGCINQDQPISLDITGADAVCCGPCGQEITDISE